MSDRTPATICLDIETLRQTPYPYVIRDPTTARAPRTHKSAEAIARWREELATSQLEDLTEQSSLEPLYGGIVCVVGIAVSTVGPDGEWMHRDPVALQIATDDETGERAMLTQLQAGLARYPMARFVIASGSGYDYRWLALRAAHHGLWELAARMYVDKPWGTHRHLDVLAAWRGAERSAKGRLIEVAQYLGVDVTPTIDGSQVTDEWCGGGRDRVVAHCLEDVRVLRETYWRMRLAGWLDADDPPPEVEVHPPRGSVADLQLQCRRALSRATPRQIEDAQTVLQMDPIDLDRMDRLQLAALAAALTLAAGRSGAGQPSDASTRGSTE